MTLIIDGHNLIGAGVFPDILLSDEDDEAKLVARLKVWRSRIRRKMVVIFDRGIPGGRDHRLSGGGVDVVFAANPTEADDLIRRRLRAANRHTVLITNDDALAREAEACGVERWRGYEFVMRLALRMPDIPTPEPGEEWDVRLSKAEVEAWLEEFRAARRARRAKRRPAVIAGQGPAVNGAHDAAEHPKPKRRKPRAASSRNGASATPAGAARSGLGKSKPGKQSQRKQRRAARARRQLRSE